VRETIARRRGTHNRKLPVNHGSRICLVPDPRKYPNVTPKHGTDAREQAKKLYGYGRESFD
jgi:hypothetical protein